MTSSLSVFSNYSYSSLWHNSVWFLICQLTYFIYYYLIIIFWVRCVYLFCHSVKIKTYTACAQRGRSAVNLISTAECIKLHRSRETQPPPHRMNRGEEQELTELHWLLQTRKYTGKKSRNKQKLTNQKKKEIFGCVKGNCTLESNPVTFQGSVTVFNLSINEFCIPRIKDWTMTQNPTQTPNDDSWLLAFKKYSSAGPRSHWLSQ